MTAYILSDLDGTLLDRTGRLSARSAKTLARIVERGHRIAVATGRGYASIRQTLSPVRWRDPFVLYNGAVLFDPVQERVLAGHWLTADELVPIAEAGRAEGCLPFWFLLDAGGREVVLHEDLTAEADRRFLLDNPGDERFRRVDRLQVPDGCRGLSVMFLGEREQLEAIFERVAERLPGRVNGHLGEDVYYPGQYVLDFGHVRANKREGLLAWAERVGCEPGEVAVYGDNVNDIGMFEAAGVRIAVANAIPQLKELADRIAPAHTEDGVARDLEAWLFADERQ